MVHLYSLAVDPEHIVERTSMLRLSERKRRYLMSNDVENARHSVIYLLRSGHSPEEAVTELDYCLSWVYKWQRRFEEDGWNGLVSRSRAPCLGCAQCHDPRINHNY
jgi:hypothetical protein